MAQAASQGRLSSVSVSPACGRVPSTVPAPKVETAEAGTQAGGGGVSNAEVQAGDGKLLSEEELRDKANDRELRVRNGIAMEFGVWRFLAKCGMPLGFLLIMDDAHE